MGKLFGTDGIRGKANVYPMSPDLVLRLGQVVGRYFESRSNNPRILIGKDTRCSGYMLEQALGAGICSVGVDVGLLGPLPTPGIAYLTRGMRACAGVVISASHNSYEDNGIKIFSADGYKLPDHVEQALEGVLMRGFDLDAASEHSFPTGANIGRAKRVDDSIGQYAVFLKEQFPKHLTLDGMRIALDCAHGASYKVAPKVFEELGGELMLRGVSPNGRNINDQCGATAPKGLVSDVALYRADIGLAFDGDADRLIVVDDQADIVDGDQILAICAKYMKQKKTLKGNTLVATVMSNMGLDLAMAELGIKVERTSVGDRYVVDEMRRGNFALGGEQSGHLIFRNSQTTGDGILAALFLLEIVKETGKPISELKKCMSLLPQVLRNVEVKAKKPLEELPKLTEYIAKCEKSLGKKGRVLFRYSGTEKLARVMVEGESQGTIEQMAGDLAGIAAEACR